MWELLGCGVNDAAGEAVMMDKSWRCACAAVVLGMLPPIAGAAPGYFSWSGAGSKYARALALNEQGRYAVNSFGPEIPYQGASINGKTMVEPVGSLGGYTTQIRSLNNLGEASASRPRPQANPIPSCIRQGACRT